MILSIAGFLIGNTTLQAQTADPFIPIIQLLDADLPFIDLNDGTLEDWHEIIGPPSLFAGDFSIENGYDPSNLDFGIWLAYHSATGRLYVAIERLDDFFVNEYNGTGNPFDHDGAIEIRIDGDQSGGQYAYAPSCCETDTEWKNLNNRQAQSYAAVVGTDGALHIRHSGAAEWVTESPFAAGGGLVDLENGRSLLEFYITAFDALVWDSPNDSAITEFPVGGLAGTIGIDIIIPDYDDAPAGTRALASLSSDPIATQQSSSAFPIGELIPTELVGECFSEDCSSIVKSVGWANIKIKVWP